ncbi:hypothetical protein Tco_0868494 [Tanacetum coccineum]
MGGDEIEVSDDESFDLEEETAKFFKIETDVFNYETPLCLAFNEFNYLLKVDPDLLTKDIMRCKTYEDYKDDWIYKWNENVPWVWREDGYCNGGNLLEAYHIGNSLHYQDLEWHETLEDSELKDEALRNKAIIEDLIRECENETHEEGHELCSIKTHEVSICQIKRYKMIKYSFNDEEEYVAVKEDEYDDLTITTEEACRAYQEIFRMMDEGWMLIRGGNEQSHVSIPSLQEDTAYPCLRSPKTSKETSSMRRIQRRPIRRIQDIVYEYSGRYQAWSLLQETPIRRIQYLGYAVSN